MTDEERRDLDLACLQLMGWTGLQWRSGGEYWCDGTQGYTYMPPGWYGHGPNGECYHPGRFGEDLALVVPLAEALRARGWGILMRRKPSSAEWEVRLWRGEDDKHEAVYTTSCALPEALVAALRAALENRDA